MQVCVCWGGESESNARSAVPSAEVWLVQCISERAFRTHNTHRRSPSLRNQHTCNGGVLTQGNSVKVIPIFSPHFYRLILDCTARSDLLGNDGRVGQGHSLCSCAKFKKCSPCYVYVSCEGIRYSCNTLKDVSF